MYIFLVLLISAALVVLDQVTKFAAVHCLAPTGTSFQLWDGVLEFTYVENHGIAWGLLQNQRWLVTVVTSLMLLFVLFVLLSGRFRNSKLVTVGGVLILAGGIGNLIDRLTYGYVIDFIHYYKWFDFPVFNVADCCVTIGAVIILVYAFFFSGKEKPKEESADGTVSLESDNGTDGATS